MTPLKPVQKQIIASTDQLAELYDIPAGTWSAWRTKGIGPKFSKFGRNIVYRLEDVEDFLQVHKLKRVRNRAGRVVAFKQTPIDFGSKTAENDSEPTPEIIEAITQEGTVETFQTRNLAAPEMNFLEMIEVQVRATKQAADLIPFSTAGKAYITQALATIETMAAWICQLERKIANEI